MYWIRMTCADCGRDYKLSSETPKDQRNCPLCHTANNGWGEPHIPKLVKLKESPEGYAVRDNFNGGSPH